MKRIIRVKKNMASLVAGAVVVSLIVVLGGAMNAHSQSYQSLYPCFKELSGWQADKPEGMKMDMGGMKMLNALRSYTRGDQKISATIMMGTQAMAQAAAAQGMMNMETDQGKVVMKPIDGFMTSLVLDKQDKSGAVTVILLPADVGGAIFTMAFEGMSEDEAMDLARSFDWNMMKNKVEALK
jgi:hypothetical protein